MELLAILGEEVVVLHFGKGILLGVKLDLLDVAGNLVGMARFQVLRVFHSVHLEVLQLLVDHLV